MANLKLLLLVLTIHCVFSTFIDAAPNFNDPTKPNLIKKHHSSKVVTITKQQQLLTAIFIKKGLKQAIINNKLYNLGEFFNKQKIVEIKTNQVVLQNNQGFTRLSLITPLKKRKKR